MRAFQILLLLVFSTPAWAVDMPQAMQENAVWEIFSNRQTIRAVLASNDDHTLWVGSEGGLEQRDIHSRDLLRVYSTLDGLPDNAVSSLAEADGGGLWVGTEGGGLAYRAAHGAWQTYSRENSPLPNNFVQCLTRDTAGLLWIGTADKWGQGGLASLDANGNWHVFNTSNSSLPENLIHALAPAADGGLWVGTNQGLAKRSANGAWQVYTAANSGLPADFIQALQVDRDGSVWIGTQSAGLAHWHVDGRWTVYHFDNSDMPDNWVESLALDDGGNLWIGTSWDGGLAMRRPDDTWRAFEMASAALLPADFIRSLASDRQGGILIGTELGLVQREQSGDWHAIDDGQIPLRDNTVHALLADDSGGVWIGTAYNDARSLSYLSATGEWRDAPFYFGTVNALVSDGANGAWVANNSGLVHLASNTDWMLYNMDNTPLPDNHIWSLARDSKGGLWVGAGLSDGDGGAWTGDNSRGGGLAYRDEQGQWTIYQSANSPLPGNQVRALAIDQQGGVWVGLFPHLESGTVGGLAYRSASGDWQVFSAANSPMPGNAVRTLLTDAQGGVWVGLADANLSGEPDADTAGLLYRSATGNWTLYNTLNTDEGLPDNRIESLAHDAQGGIWIGASGAVSGGGLIHRSASGAWTTFHVDNSGLPADWVTAIQPDYHGGWWVATGWSGLAHLSFGEKPELAQLISDNQQRDTVVNGERAAIIILARGQSSGYNQAQALAFMSTYAYHSLHARGYDNDEIYFLSYRADLDFNADGKADTQLVDAPLSMADFRAGGVPRDLTVADVEQAFVWAENQGRLNQALLVIFTGHGVPDGLLLDPVGRQKLDSATLNSLLTRYQTRTGNNAVVMLEACHSGSIGAALERSQRTIISSSGEGLAYYGDLGRVSFIKLYFDALRKGDNFTQAFQAARQDLHNRAWPFNHQTPRLSDNLGGCLNGCWGALPGVLTLTVATSGATVAPGTQVDLQVQTQVAAASIERVWASVITPRIASQRNEQGYSRRPEPVVNLRVAANGDWRGRFDGFQEDGEYLFAIKARDNQGFITEAAPLHFNVSGGNTLQAAVFNPTSGLVDLPAVAVTSAGQELGLFHVQLRLSDPNTLTFSLLPETLAVASQTDNSALTHFNFDSNLMQIPLLAVTGSGDARFGVDLTLLSSDFQFGVKLDSLVSR